jgi:hypothetical protein
MRTILLIGQVDSFGRSKTTGTGFLVSLSERTFLITCRHVVEASKPEQLIAIPACKYVLPRSAQEMIILENTGVFHPDDNSEQSFDIVVFDVTDKQDDFIKLGCDALPFERISGELDVPSGTDLLVHGYSVSFLEMHYSPQSDLPLPPEQRRAIVEKVPLQNLCINGFSRSINKIQFARTDDGVPIGPGVSGAAVFRTSDERCVGILIGSVDAAWNFLDGVDVPSKGGAFVPAGYVREAVLNAFRLRPHS